MSSKYLFEQRFFHDFCRRATGEQESFHLLHIRLCVSIEEAVAFTKGVQTRLSVLGKRKPVLRTFSVTKETDLTATTFRRKGVALVEAELYLGLRPGHCSKTFRADITQTMFLIYKVVTAVDVSVMFYHKIASTGLCIDTYSRLHPTPEGKGGIKQIHKAFSNIRTHPFVEYVAHETPEAFSRHRPWSKHGTVF